MPLEEKDKKTIEMQKKKGEALQGIGCIETRRMKVNMSQKLLPKEGLQAI
jgi:hypothetical protein